MTPEQITRQSKQAYLQWAKQWREHATFHRAYEQKTFNDFACSGVGKVILCVANGYSFEENLPTIKKWAPFVDIMACDKTLGHLLENGIKPKYVVVCDANVSYEKYLEPYKEHCRNTILFQNVCGNPKWTSGANWKDKYFFVNMDVMNYEKEFSALSGCRNFVTAGTNVSNMMIVLLTQSDNHMRRNLFGYDKIALIGFDYSWRADGKYYAFEQTGDGKFNYMRHIYGLSARGKMIFTSNNLNSSASWMKNYIDAYKIPVAQCSPDSLLVIGKTSDLDRALSYRYIPQEASKVQGLLREKIAIADKMKAVDDKLKDIASRHFYAHRATI